MTLNVKLGKKPARPDHRLPRLSKHGAVLGPPPPQSNWWTEIECWGMLKNDMVGNCVEAAILHQILQVSSYATPGHGHIPTDAEALAFYETATGYTPANPASDQGSYMAGPGGVLEYWINNGVTCGGVVNKPLAVLAITKPRLKEWKQAISAFGSVLIGLQIPEIIISSDTVPFVWSDPTGPVAGGHEVIGVGYDDATGMFDIISWGDHYKCTGDFLLGTVDEVYTVLNPEFLNALGVSPAGIDHEVLLADMELMRAQA